MISGILRSVMHGDDGPVMLVAGLSNSDISKLEQGQQLEVKLSDNLSLMIFAGDSDAANQRMMEKVVADHNRRKTQ